MSLSAALLNGDGGVWRSAGAETATQKEPDVDMVEEEDEEIAAEKVAAKEGADAEPGSGSDPAKEEVELSLDERIAALKAEMMEEMAPSDGEKKELETEKKEETQEVKLPDFIRDDDDFEAITESRENLNKFAQRIYEGAVKDLSEGFKKEMTDLRAQLGPYIEQQIQSGIATREAIKDFHDQNPDLRKYPKTVMKVANELANENPKWGLNEIINELGKATRERLGIKSKTSSEKEKGDPNTQEKKPPITFKGKSATRKAETPPDKNDRSNARQWEEMEAAKPKPLFK